MWSIFRKCIFCDQYLPKKPTGVGEHVIPASIYGFWSSHDVCSDCIKYFGSGVDRIAVTNPQILNSMHLLDYEDLEKKFEQMPYIAEEKESKEKVLLIRRKGEFKTKVNKVSEDFLECSENDIDMVGIPYIKAQYRNMLPLDLFNQEIQLLKEKYFKIAPGESVHSSLLGLTMRKSQITNVKYDLDRIPSITPLIAKIVFIAIHYFVPLDIVGSLRNYWEFRDHARFEKPISDFNINTCILQNKDIRFPFHCLRFFGGGHSLMVDCMFFGYDNWRSIFYSNKEVKLIDGEDKEVDTISFYMDFLERENRKKFIEYIYPNQEKLIMRADM